MCKIAFISYQNAPRGCISIYFYTNENGKNTLLYWVIFLMNERLKLKEFFANLQVSRIELHGLGDSDRSMLAYLGRDFDVNDWDVKERKDGW